MLQWCLFLWQLRGTVNTNTSPHWGPGYSGYNSTGNSDGQFTQRSSHIEETDPIATMYTTLMTTIPVVIQEDS